MEEVISNPGLQHLAEKVFWDLSSENLKICAQINQSCKQILQNPIFGLRKFKGLSKKNRNDWIKGIQSVKNSDKGIAILSYLKWNLKKEVLVDIPFYSSPDVQDDFRKRIMEICVKRESSDKDIEIMKILAPLTDNPNAPHDYDTPLVEAAYRGHTEIVKILAPLTDNPNSPNADGYTPIHYAASNRHAEIVKILAPLTDNPNAPDRYGRTPIYWATHDGDTEIVKYLAPLTENPNAPDKWGETPIYCAALNGHTEIVKILAPLTDNPNAGALVRNKYGTPSSVAKNIEIIEILEFYTDQQNNT